MAKQKPKKKRPTKNARKANKDMQQTPTTEIIQAMDYMLSVLKARGVAIKNWDNPEQELGLLRVYKCQPYFMAATKEQIDNV